VAISTLCFDTDQRNYLRTSSIPRLPGEGKARLRLRVREP